MWCGGDRSDYITEDAGVKTGVILFTTEEALWLNAEVVLFTLEEALGSVGVERRGRTVYTAGSAGLKHRQFDSELASHFISLIF